ncbi:MAG TPA: aldehyde ferredoxin oxidoreductase N-terminal domain-containing protein, partial [Methanofastidiosum sp.]|nr:aldehyde ferredoxin oxidoreductase N-terminal domain-containing protein [Methanofastidiosum sp.]
MVYGYAGKILHIDLTTGKIEVETPNEDFYRKWLGGNGFIIKYLYDEVKKGIDPLSPEAVSVFASGPLSGTLAHGAGRTHFGAKSPQTGLLADSSAGGGFAAMLKYAGYDAVVIKGKAASPVMIVINNDKVEIREAERFWGL